MTEQMCPKCEELKSLLRDAYPPRRLRSLSILGIGLAGSSLLLSFIGGFHLLHPVLATPLLLSSGIFLWIAKRLEKKLVTRELFDEGAEQQREDEVAVVGNYGHAEDASYYEELERGEGE